MTFDMEVGLKLEKIFWTLPDFYETWAVVEASFSTIDDPDPELLGESFHPTEW